MSESREKGRCQTGHIEKVSWRISYRLLENHDPPESLFSIFNSTFGTDQKSFHDTLITYSYLYSRKLTLEYSSGRVSRSEGDGEEWFRGFGRLLHVCNYPLSCTVGYATRRVFQSMIFFTVVFCSKWNYVSCCHTSVKIVFVCLFCWWFCSSKIICIKIKKGENRA